MKESEFVRRLRHEIGSWQDEGLVDTILAERLLARYVGSDSPVRSKLAVVLAFLGATLIGIGMIALVAANWESLSGAAKLALLLLTMTSAYYSGYRLRYVGETYHGTGSALIFLGALLFGANIFLVAQAVHINAEAPSLLVLWALGVLPLGWFLESRPLLVLGQLLLTLALGWEASFWTETTDGFCAAFLLWGVVLVALGRLVPRLQGHTEQLGLVTLLVTLSVLASFGGESLFSSSAVAEWFLLPAGGKLRLALLGVATLAVALVRLRATWEERVERRETWGLLGMVAVAVFAVLGGSLDPALVRTVFNLVLLGVLVGGLWLGYARRDPVWVQLALGFFALEVFARYTELLWSQLPMEVFFLTAGVVLLGGGLALERLRRKLLQKLTEAKES